jgi:hypothetical protein
MPILNPGAKANRRLKWLLVLIAPFIAFPILYGIGISIETKYVVAEPDHPLRRLVGKSCELTHPWNIYGWRSFDDEKSVGEYQLTSQDYAITRFVLSKDVLPSGSKVEIVDILVADSIWLEQIELVVVSETFLHRMRMSIEDEKILCT